MNNIVNFFGTREKQWGCEFLPFDFRSTNKQTNKEFINLNHFMGEKSCLIRSKKKNKTMQKNKNGTKNQ